jgi:hypothetical protein
MTNKNYNSLTKSLIESKRTTVSKSTRKAKIARAIGSLSTSAAKKKNDPIYKMMMYHKDKYKKYKEQLMKKYSSRVRSKAMR